MNKLLKISKINLSYNTDNNLIKVLQDVSLEVDHKDTVSIVGESGSGKTSLIMLIGGLEKATSGKIQFKEFEISNLNEDQISEIRRKNIGIVFQSFYLIPNYTALENVSLTLEINRISNPEQKAKDMLSRFGLGQRLNNLPSQLSGGEQQRVAIARALATQPRLLVCDEPTSALDVSIQAQILNLLKDLQEQLNLTILFISHDLPVVRQMCDRIAVLKNGKLCEVSMTEELFKNPSHEYTKELLTLMPKIESIYN